jgi:cytochrome c biogenesis protein CcmG/thiol:disulfide interchange protein DsbE
MKPNIFLLLIPAALFAGFIWLAINGLGQDKHGQPLAPNTGKMMPQTQMPILDSKKMLSSADIKGKKTLVNFFASWCVPCAAEHDFLKAVHEALPLPIIGIVYKDKDAKIKKYLSQHGNPFKIVALDREGRAAIDWGVTGVPETFLIDADGTILAHSAGPLSIAIWDKYFKPQLHDVMTGNDKKN